MTLKHGSIYGIRKWTVMIKQAFTLIELLVVISIIAILSTMIVSLVGSGSIAADAEETRSAMTVISRGLETYKAQTNYYPKSQWTINDPQPAWNPNDPDDTTNIWDRANYSGDDPFAFTQVNRLVWRLGTRMSSDDKDAMEAAVADALTDLEAEIVPGGSWTHFTSKHSGWPINDSRHYSGPTLGEAGARAHNEATPKIDNLRKRYKKIGDKFMRDGSNNPILISEMDRSHNDWQFRWGSGGSSAFWCAWNYYSIQTKSDTKRDFLTLDVIELDSISEHLISEDGESLLDAWGNPIVYVERDYEPMPLMGIHPVWQGTKLGRPSSGSKAMMGDMSRERGRRLIIPDADNDGIISEDEAALTDVRCHAYKGDEYRFELWSAGPDGLFRGLRGSMEDETNVNADNVSMER